jgi:hypothetical protein
MVTGVRAGDKAWVEAKACSLLSTVVVLYVALVPCYLFAVGVAVSRFPSKKLGPNASSRAIYS